MAKQIRDAFTSKARPKSNKCIEKQATPSTMDATNVTPRYFCFRLFEKGEKQSQYPRSALIGNLQKKDK